MKRYSVCAFCEGLCDFQYLPIHKNKETNKMESLTDTIIPKEPKDTTFLQQDVPHFMLPPVFSRTDIPSSYNYQPDLLPASESITYKVITIVCIGCHGRVVKSIKFKFWWLSQQSVGSNLGRVLGKDALLPFHPWL